MTVVYLHYLTLRVRLIKAQRLPLNTWIGLSGCVCSVCGCVVVGGENQLGFWRKHASYITRILFYSELSSNRSNLAVCQVPYLYSILLSVPDTTEVRLIHKQNVVPSETQNDGTILSTPENQHSAIKIYFLLKVKLNTQHILFEM